MRSKRSLGTQSRTMGSCRSCFQCTRTAPRICPLSYSSGSSLASMMRSCGSLRCASNQSGSTSTSGCAYPAISIPPRKRLCLCGPSILEYVRGNGRVVMQSRPLVGAERRRGIAVGGHRAEKAKWLAPLVQPPVGGLRGHLHDIKRVQRKDFPPDDGASPAAESDDDVRVGVLLEAGIPTGGQLKIPQFEAHRPRGGADQCEPRYAPPPHPSHVPQAELVRLRLNTRPPKGSPVKRKLLRRRSDRPHRGQCPCVAHRYLRPLSPNCPASVSHSTGPWLTATIAPCAPITTVLGTVRMPKRLASAGSIVASTSRTCTWPENRPRSSSSAGFCTVLHGTQSAVENASTTGNPPSCATRSPAPRRTVFRKFQRSPTQAAATPSTTTPSASRRSRSITAPPPPCESGRPAANDSRQNSRRRN